jgi:crotonobetainyl-CoA:carnitine CoA-transferase CaiB-like acyl-CoA transferase
MQAYTGILAAERKVQEGRIREITSSPLIDMATGYGAVSSILAALFARERDGQGQKIEISLLANGLLMQVQPLTRLMNYPSLAQQWTDEELPLLRSSGLSGAEIQAIYDSFQSISPATLYYRIYPTANSAIAVACLSEPLRQRLSKLLGLDDPRFDAGYDTTDPAYTEILERLSRYAEGLFLEETAESWIVRLREAGIPVARVGYIEEMLDDPQAVANDLLIQQEHPVVGTVKTVGPISRMSRTPPEAGMPSPALGQHTDEVMREVGYDTTAIAEMRAAGAFGP